MIGPHPAYTIPSRTLGLLFQVLAKLYVTRSDVQYAVRNGALHNWKTLVVRNCSAQRRNDGLWRCCSV